jgi:hypothetical protein
MSLELVNTLATFGTFVVIAATAIVAIVQLRHARGSNQIAALNEIRETDGSEEMQIARHFAHRELATKLQDPDFRYQLNVRPARTDENRPLIGKINALGNFYEGMGTLVKARLVDRQLALEIYSGKVIGDWEALAPVTALSRRVAGDALWENFEYLFVLSQDWVAAHPSGTYPAGLRRATLKDEWLEADELYAASLAPA